MSPRPRTRRWRSPSADQAQSLSVIRPRAWHAATAIRPSCRSCRAAPDEGRAVRPGSRRQPGQRALERWPIRKPRHDGGPASECRSSWTTLSIGYADSASPPQLTRKADRACGVRLAHDPLGTGQADATTEIDISRGITTGGSPGGHIGLTATARHSGPGRKTFMPNGNVVRAPRPRPRRSAQMPQVDAAAARRGRSTDHVWPGKVTKSGHSSTAWA